MKVSLQWSLGIRILKMASIWRKNSLLTPTLTLALAELAEEPAAAILDGGKYLRLRSKVAAEVGFKALVFLGVWILASTEVFNFSSDDDDEAAAALLALFCLLLR